MTKHHSIPELLNKIDMLEKKISKLQDTGTEDMQSEIQKEKYRRVFEYAPISIWEEDFSRVKLYIDTLKNNGIKDFKHYFKDHPESILSCIEKIKIIAINKATISLHKAQTKDELLCRFAEIFTEKSLDSFTTQLLALINGENSYESETELKTLSGDIFYALIKWVVPTEFKHTWSRVFVSISDITEKKNAGELLRIQRDISINFSKFHNTKDICFQLLQNVTQIEAIDSGGVYIRDEETGDLDLIAHLGLGEEFIKISTHYENTSPQSTIVLKGKPLYATYVDSGLPLDDIRKKEGIKALAIIPVKHENEVIAVLNVASHTHSEIPETSRSIIESIGVMIGSFIAHAKAESALQNSEKRYQMLIHNIPYVTWISDSSWSIIFISENVVDYYGYTPKEIYENNLVYWFDRIHPDDIEYIRKRWKLYFDQDIPFDVEYRIKRKDGKWIWLHDKSVNKFEKKGEKYAYGIFADITKRKEMEEQLRQAEKMQAIGQLAGGIAHDFNNQLTAILTYTEIIKSSITSDPKLLEYSQNIINCINHSVNLTSQLLAFSRKGKYQSIVIDLHTLIMEIINILYHSIDKKIIIEKDLTAESHFITGDPSQIQNALLNIGLNARDALPDGGCLSFQTENIDLDERKINEIHLNVHPGKMVLITIRDNGIGMDREVLNRVFEPFFTTKEKNKGTGMGMAAVYGTIKNHKGAIQVTSQLRKGTTVQIYLPVIEVSFNPQNKEIKAENEKTSAHILFVDDEQMIRESLRIYLSKLDYKISLCENGAKALEFYSENWDNIDIVIMDMIMPEMNGHETFLKMKKINPAIKALLVSGHTTGKDIQEALKSGISGFLHKPYSQSEISKKITEILHRKE